MVTKISITLIIIILAGIATIGVYYAISKISNFQFSEEVLPAPKEFEASAGPPAEWHGERDIVVYLSWRAVEGATSYRIYRSLNPNGPWKFVQDGFGSAFDDDFGLLYVTPDFDFPEGFTELYYYIAAIDEQRREGKASNIVRVTR
ncbi:MAG: hypothetical protein AAB567_00515 [Patescibacteria group bacterium]